MPTALILGCSHAAGAQMHLEPGFDTKDYSPVQETEYGALYSYPVLLAEMLGYTAHNHAVSGGSNDAMFRIYAEQSQTYDLIIACWTGRDRGEVLHDTHNYWIPINAGGISLTQQQSNNVLKQGINVGLPIKDKEIYKEYGKQWLNFEINDQRTFNNKIKNIMSLNMLAHHNGTKVINLESFGGFYPPEFSYPTGIFWPTDNMDDEFINFCTRNNFPKEPGGHYFRPAHQAYAEHIKQKVDQLNFL